MVGPPNNEKKQIPGSAPDHVSTSRYDRDVLIYTPFFSLSFSFVFDASCQHLKI